MAIIPSTEARSRFTSDIAAIYSDFIEPMSFLRSFFTSQQTYSKYVKLEVERHGEPKSVDILRGSSGKRNEWTVSTEKTFLPPFYNEWFDKTELEIYDLVVQAQDVSGKVYGKLVREAADKLSKLQAKIDRAYEFQCASALDDGVVIVNAGTNVDFKRKAASLVDLTSTPWTDNANKPEDNLKTAAEFLRTKGKARGGTFNMIMGSNAYNAFVNNTNTTGRADIRNFSLDAIRMPQRNSVGGVLHGITSAGSWNFLIWTYPEFFTEDGTDVPYLDPNKVHILPENPAFQLNYTAVPQLLSKDGSRIQDGAYLVQEFDNAEGGYQKIDIRSAGLATLVAVDQVWTAEVVATGS